jgi:hypothetical protein
MMKIVSYNVRGLGGAAKKKEVVRLLGYHLKGGVE